MNPNSIVKEMGDKKAQTGNDSHSKASVPGAIHFAQVLEGNIGHSLSSGPGRKYTSFFK